MLPFDSQSSSFSEIISTCLKLFFPWPCLLSQKLEVYLWYYIVCICARISVCVLPFQILKQLFPCPKSL